MGQAIGELLPYAIGVAISPIPIIAIILMLLSARAGANSLAFLGGWIVGVAGASIVLLALSGVLDADASGQSDSSSTLKLVLGGVLIVLAGRNFRKRPKPGEEAELPKWMASIDTLTPVKAAGLAFVLAAVNPKNLLIIAGAMISLSQYDLSAADDAVVILVFVVIAISTVAAPVIVYLVAGEKAQHLLDEMKSWLGQHNAAVMATLLLVIGVDLIGKGVSGLSA